MADSLSQTFFMAPSDACLGFAGHAVYRERN
jgi:hypothetical protein